MDAGAHTYTGTRVRTHERTHACMYARIHARTHASTQTSSHARTHILIHARTAARTHARTHTHTHACTHARTHAHKLKHKHTHMHCAYAREEGENARRAINFVSIHVVRERYTEATDTCHSAYNIILLLIHVQWPAVRTSRSFCHFSDWRMARRPSNRALYINVYCCIFVSAPAPPPPHTPSRPSPTPPPPPPPIITEHDVVLLLIELGYREANAAVRYPGATARLPSY